MNWYLEEDKNTARKQTVHRMHSNILLDSESCQERKLETGIELKNIQVSKGYLDQSLKQAVSKLLLSETLTKKFTELAQQEAWRHHGLGSCQGEERM